nr:MAG TPA: hypothetical protein [Caudoviricetes sp.]
MYLLFVLDLRFKSFVIVFDNSIIYYDIIFVNIFLIFFDNIFIEIDNNTFFLYNLIKNYGRFPKWDYLKI